jgi:Tol biopolymer transport system component
MLIKVTRIALVFAALGLASERGGAMTETKDTGRTSRFLGTEGDFVELAQAGNRPPVVRRSIANRRATEGARFSFIIPLNTFADPDGDSMTIRIRENVGWLSANQNRRRLSGTPLTFDNPALVRVRATDQRGASVATTFRVRIRPLTIDDDAPPGQSTPSPNENGTTDSTEPSISADGRFVAHVFENADGDEQSIVVRDFTSAGFSGRGSFIVAGPRSFEPGDASAALFSSPSISADGRIVAFVAQTAPEASVQGVEIRVVRIADSDPLDLETKFVQSILRSDDPLARDALVFSTDVSLSADGRLVAFEQDTNIVVAKIGTKRRLVIRNATSPSLSGNGRRIAYEEVTGADERDILVATLNDSRTRVIERTIVGVDSVNSEFGPLSSSPVVSADGNFVAFESDASNLDLTPPDDDINGVRDIFVFNVREGTLSLASVDADGQQNGADASNPSLSADGRLVAFDTNLPNFVPQVLVRELGPQGEPIGELRIVSVDSAGNPGNLGAGGGSFGPSLSADGRFVTFQSTSTNLTEDAADNQGIAVFLAPTLPGCEVEFGMLDDPQGSSCTQAALEIGTPGRGEIDPAFDTDWYRIELIEGETYRFELQADSSSATPLGDPFLELRDGEGEPVVDDEGEPVDDDDSGGGLNALLDFAAPSTDTFFVVARAFGGQTGDYVVSVVTPPPAVTVAR